MKKHILVISQYFYPEQFRINDICTEWVKKGYKVTVLTGIPNYPQGKFYEGFGLFKRRTETYNGIQIIRLPIISRGKGPIRLSLNYMSFVVSGFFWKLWTKLRADFVFIYEVSPMTQALPGVQYAKRRRIPCYIYVTDLWPENVEIVAGITNKFVLKKIGSMVDSIYGNCGKIFVSSRSFVKAITERGVEPSKVVYWPQYAEDYYKPSIKSESNHYNNKDTDSFNIIFAGNIGTAQGLGILPEVAVRLKEKGKRVCFHIVGDGRYKKDLINLVKARNVFSMFSFLDKRPPYEIPKLMHSCDATLICLSKSKVFAITLPAKTQSCLACGIPIIVSADGEIQRVIDEAQAGYCGEAENVTDLESNIIKLMNNSIQERKEMAIKGTDYYHKNFDKEKLLKEIDYYFE